MAGVGARWCPAGILIGTLYTDDITEDTRAVLPGSFPEQHVSHCRDVVVEATLRLAPGTYADLPLDRLELREIVAVDQSSDTRSWSMSAQYDTASPAELAVTFPEVRLRFTSAPIWEHLAF
nr:hypothetical protein [uncultured Celeribacter sp.]